MPMMETSAAILALVAVGAYLLGSVPFGIVITRALGLGDLRKIGSGNIGATNVLRTGNKGAALATLLLDAGKGGIAVALARLVGGQDAALLAALASFLGHLFPVWLGFKGGKGVATYLGTLLVLDWRLGLATCATWAVTAGGDADILALRFGGGGFDQSVGIGAARQRDAGVKFGVECADLLEALAQYSAHCGGD